MKFYTGHKNQSVPQEPEPGSMEYDSSIYP